MNTTTAQYPNELPLFSWSAQALCTDVSDPMDISSATYTKAADVAPANYTPVMKAWLETKDPPYGGNVSNLDERDPSTPLEDFRQNWLIGDDYLPWVKHPDMSDRGGDHDQRVSPRHSNDGGMPGA